MGALVDLQVAGDPIAIPITVGRKRLQGIAKHWHYVLRSRRRWILDPHLRETIEARAVSHLAGIGVGRETLEKIGAKGVVQVNIDTAQPTMQIPTGSSSGDAGWECRLIPWEYLLTAASKKYRTEPLLVVRQLKCHNNIRPLCAPDCSALFIQSDPGQLRDYYNFDIEWKVLESHFSNQVTWSRLTNPSLEQLRVEAGRLDPQVLHVTGFDNFQGSRICDPEQKLAPSSIKDGMFLRNEKWDEVAIESSPIAGALTAGVQRPAIVSFNFYNSSARTAAFAVQHGATVAVGFQDYIDDRVAEVFFANFYWNLPRSGWNMLDAFKQAMKALDPYRDKLRGAGIVLWSAQSLVAPSIPSPPAVSTATSPTIQTPVTDWVQAEVVPHEKLNYSILQNSARPLFETFSIYKFKPVPLSGLEVDVELQVGSERFPYNRTFEMKHHVLDLAEEIRVGLTSSLVRSLRESIRTTLSVRVRHQKLSILSTTFHVTLLPLDEWRDDEENGCWLPSFVLPRDPAVLKVVICAQRYLMALRDDANAGFDGYQPVEADPQNIEDIDSQVRAIWYALLHDYNLNYINPPPTFTSFSQRLRTPSETLNGARGTCIDLALLVAACLEFMDLKPVIFLLDGHAFPGYWGSEESRKQCLVRPNPAPLSDTSETSTPIPGQEEEEESPESDSFAQKVSWLFDKSRYQEVFEAVQNGDLIPLETTLLTSRGSFADAIEQGIQNLSNPNEFQSMLDIGLARMSDVTPLPRENP
jgi:hypothetical protein